VQYVDVEIAYFVGYLKQLGSAYFPLHIGSTREDLISLGTISSSIQANM
jgi:hypothetical protein